ncbi:nucleotidyltransferase domain-containing protein [Kitasatospora sp. NPDC089913]|uniref:nucleotidyltransferase domain-containing protein n=1 Tax=Streptomycetaceae TaxID=2062 RepID=UPI00087A84E0|nr:aminoglycoside adenylyltransferase [Streptomyces sp. TLI_053]SDT19461.1 Aminoglycoside-2''-adenylyltransferase [Streptomyces sp. TLI_053]
MDRERADGQLAQIAETVGLARRLGTRVWLRGGWAMDFFLGAPTRDHEDIDWFAPAADAAALAAGLGALGYARLEGVPPEQQLDFVKDGLESSFALVDLAPDGRVLVAGGPWAGTAWPAGMLDGPPGRLGGLVCPVVAAGAQIEIKRMMPVWDPRRPRRAKDAEDIARLRAALAGA